MAAPVSVKALEKQTAAGAAAKRPLLPPRDDVSLMDYDFGLCSNQIELQSKGVVSNKSCRLCSPQHLLILSRRAGKRQDVTRVLVSEINQDRFANKFACRFCVCRESIEVLREHA